MLGTRDSLRQLFISWTAIIDSLAIWGGIGQRCSILHLSLALVEAG